MLAERHNVMAGEKILVVDDEPDFCLIVQGQLEKEGFDVDLAYNGVEGLEKVQANPPDAIVLDVDNGPGDLTDSSNSELYGPSGISRIFRICARVSSVYRISASYRAMTCSSSLSGIPFRMLLK